jgi:hypothetical protein
MQAVLGNVDAAKKKKKKEGGEEWRWEQELEGDKEKSVEPYAFISISDNNRTPVPTRHRSYILCRLSCRIEARLTLPLRIDPVEPYSSVESSLVPYLELLSVFRLHMRLISLKCYQWRAWPSVSFKIWGKYMTP